MLSCTTVPSTWREAGALLVLIYKWITGRLPTRLIRNSSLPHTAARMTVLHVYNIRETRLMGRVESRHLGAHLLVIALFLFFSGKFQGFRRERIFAGYKTGRYKVFHGSPRTIRHGMLN